MDPGKKVIESEKSPKLPEVASEASSQCSDTLLTPRLSTDLNSQSSQAEAVADATSRASSSRTLSHGRDVPHDRPSSSQHADNKMQKMDHGWMGRKGTKGEKPPSFIDSSSKLCSQSRENLLTPGLSAFTQDSPAQKSAFPFSSIDLSSQSLHFKGSEAAATSRASSSRSSTVVANPCQFDKTFPASASSCSCSSTAAKPSCSEKRSSGSSAARCSSAVSRNKDEEGNEIFSEIDFSGPPKPLSPLKKQVSAQELAIHSMVVIEYNSKTGAVVRPSSIGGTGSTSNASERHSQPLLPPDIRRPEQLSQFSRASQSQSTSPRQTSQTTQTEQPRPLPRSPRQTGEIACIHRPEQLLQSSRASQSQSESPLQTEQTGQLPPSPRQAKEMADLQRLVELYHRKSKSKSASPPQTSLPQQPSQSAERPRSLILRPSDLIESQHNIHTEQPRQSQYIEPLQFHQLEPETERVLCPRCFSSGCSSGCSSDCSCCKNK